LLLSELLTPDRIRVPLEATEKTGVLREMTRLLADRSGGDYENILSAVLEREGVLSTGIGYGIAIPHAKSATVRELNLVCGNQPQGISFDALDGEPVRLFFLLVGPDSSAGLHVKALSRIARIIRRESVREELLKAANSDAFHQVILDAEGR
jgi:PTS system nitrogen regulatory IIA component